jgi:hypothetical protein
MQSPRPAADFTARDTNKFSVQPGLRGLALPTAKVAQPLGRLPIHRPGHRQCQRTTFTDAAAPFMPRCYEQRSRERKAAGITADPRIITDRNEAIVISCAGAADSADLAEGRRSSPTNSTHLGDRHAAACSGGCCWPVDGASR